ncbi:MAG: efflux RND transporter permease subunit [Chitinispirillaceae bacterium]|nr:efflux RND transporter permease subunit [Chitinispirillaceae bacterium]
MKITRLSVYRKFATGMIAVALCVLGFYGMRSLPVDFLPSITYPMIKVHIWWRGATPEEIDKNVADPIERQMATVDGLDYIESSAIEGMYTLLVNFKYGINADVAYQDALAAMARVARELPKNIDPPVVIKSDPSQLPVVQLTIASDRWDLVKLRTWVDEWLQDRLLSVAGVAGTEIVGGLKREVRVHLDPAALEKHGLTLPQIMQRLRSENIDLFGGRVTTGNREIIARTIGEYSSLDDIRNVQIIRDGNAKLLLGDIATVEDSHEEVRVITRLGGKPCVKLSVLKQADANTVAVAEAVNGQVAELREALPAGITLGMVENQADYVRSALDGVRNSAIEAMALVIFIVFLFLGSWRQVLVVALSMPLTLVFNFGLMKIAGFSLNIFSLGGLVIAIGVLVDNSIVVIETITRRRKEHPDLSVNECVVDAAAEVGPAIVAGTLSFLALFVPFLIVPGLVSLLFKELILVIAGIVVISLVVAITITPTVAAIALGRKKGEQKTTAFERFFDRITTYYGVLLERVVRYRGVALLLFIVSLFAGVLFLRQLGSEFLPQPDDGRIIVKVKLPTGASLEQTNKILLQLEKRIGDDKRIESMFTLAGGRVQGLYTYEIANEGELNIQLVPRRRRNITTTQFIEELRPITGKIQVPGGNVMVMQMKLKGIRKLGDADIELKITGQELPQLFDIARRTSAAMNALDHFTNIYVSMDLSRPEYRVIVDRAKASDAGVSVEDIALTMQSLVNGTVATRFRDGNEYYNIRLRIPERDIDNIDAVRNLPLAGSGGSYLRIGDIAQVTRAVGPVEIVRENQQKQVIVRGDAAGVSVGQAAAELKRALEKIDIPPGYGLSFGGVAQMMTEMVRNILGVMAFALFFSFVVLAVQFNSVKLPSLILGSIPFCLAGSAILMYMTGQPLGATVVIGILIVISATVNDGVLLLTFANELRTSDKLSPMDAVIKAAKIRLRPRVMTTVSTLAGLIPLALAIEEGGDMLRPMAVAAVGGLVMEIAVALFLMPCLYVLFSGKQQKK